ncbi:MAG: heavy metal-associated domain-containing protein [Bacillales bacterium]|nr:heavy metal-associated domain-containing protein [Bacillales bacterium]MDY6003701.1 heavy metal-associated domain-containing protein [Bacilli bacterium]
MKKSYKIEVDCAVCAGKVEAALAKLEGVNSVSINFISQKMIIDMDDSITVKDLLKTARKIEPDFEIEE